MTTRFHNPETVVDFSTPQNVSTLTVLKAFTNLGLTYGSILFAMVNLSATDPVTFIVESSEDGTYPDATAYNIVAAPLGQASLEVGPLLLRRYWRLSAQTSSPSFPVASIKWVIRGISR